MFRVGVHTSITGSIDLSVERAITNRYTTFQIFTRNPRGWNYTALSKEESKGFREKLSKTNIRPVVVHMPYLPNLASPKNDVYLKSKESLKVELKRCSTLGIPYLVTHTGSHLGKGKDKGFRKIISALNESLGEDDGTVTVLLENTAGTRNSIGASFQDIQYILEHITVSDRVAICFDTCHAFAAGYDLRSDKAVKATMNEFDQIIGIKNLKIIHINDSKGDLNSHIDRHEHIGLGRIGRNGFKAFISYGNLKYLPFILETPIDSIGNDKSNIEEIKCIAYESGIT